ncbi:MAG: lamin tail domain-containing protein [Verrucomicrobia bacterium]|nr:lamin tail domain-containing protein [Verrucomicrobiota bacterium]
MRSFHHCVLTACIGLFDSLPSSPAPAQTILREYWAGIDGHTVQALTNSPSFPDTPTGRDTTNLFEAPANWADAYGTRMRGFVRPPETGFYTFWISSDDQSHLYLSTDEDPALKRLIARVDTWTAARIWEEAREGSGVPQRSAPILLEAGRRYYVEALQKEGAGGDNLAVGWQLPNGSDERPIPGGRLAPWVVSTTPPTITAQPADHTAVEGRAAWFSVTVTGKQPLCYRWQASGVALGEATNQTLVLARVGLGDDGARFRCVVTNSLGPVVSQIATLHVLPDALPPAVTRISPTPESRVATVGQVEVTFDEPVTNVLAEALLLNGQPATNVTGAGAGPYVFEFHPVLEAGTVQMAWATPVGITDMASAANGFAGGTWGYVIDPRVPTQLIRREYWTDITGTSLGNLLADPHYPDHPSGVSFEELFEAPPHWADNYGTRMRGYVHPPASGDYRFWIATDDQGELYLSSDETPSRRVRIASVPSWTGSRVWEESRDDLYLAQRSALIRLEAGRRYYVEALQKEGGGGDNLAVGWQLPDGTLERPIPGSRLSHWQNTTNPPVVLAEPADATVAEGEAASFQVSATGGEPLRFQWWRDGAALLGERSPDLQLETLAIHDNGSRFFCVLTNFFGCATSRVATLTVTPEAVPPVVTCLNPPAGTVVRRFTQVEVWFSEGVTGVDAGDLLVNGQPAAGVTGWMAGPYVFVFPQPAAGPVDMAWAADHGILDGATVPNAFAGDAWTQVLDAAALPADVVISEFLAANQSGLNDEDGEVQDWIELHNRGTATVNLRGWSLTDDANEPGRWVLPERVLPGGGRIVVFASGKDRKPDAPGALHTNFKLSRNGEYLGLFTAESPRVAASQWSPKYPEQRNDHAYGLDPAGQYRYFASPTPGSPNGTSSITNTVATVAFSVPRGFFAAPFNLHLSTGTPGAHIRYTLDGSEPTADTGALYTNALTIQGTTLVRAAAFKANHLPSTVGTHTYFVGLSDAERSLPVLSIVTASNHLYGPSGILGIHGGTFTNGAWQAVAPDDYHNPSQTGLAWERPVSLELVHPHDNSGFQADCGLRVAGGNYIRPRYQPTSKFTFRTYFRGDYGAGRLEYPLFTNAAVASFNQLQLRAGMNDPNNPFIRDELVRRLYGDLGQVSAHGAIMNLFINGHYKGYYNPTERIEEPFCQAWHGGDHDWDVLTVGSRALDGDTAEWTRLRNDVASQDVTEPGVYLDIEKRLDLLNFADYLLVNVYAGTGDWGHNNWRCARERVPGARFRYYVWDAEWALGHYGRSVSLNSFENELAGNHEMAVLYRRLRLSPEFRLLFADRVQRHLFHGGALVETNVLARFEQLRTQMTGVLPNMQVDIASTWIPNRRAHLMSHLDGQGLLASDNAPAFSQHGGRVAPGSLLSLTAPRGTIYYTTDGTDPRERFTGAVAPTALAYTPATPVSIPGPMRIKARTWDGTNWSAVTEAEFVAGSMGVPLAITEILYHPLGGDAFEFVELFNAGLTPLDLGGFTCEGITFTFPQNSWLAPGHTLVLIPHIDPAAFAARYPHVAVFGHYEATLSNGGERLAVLDRQHRIVVAVDYKDEDGWPAEADGAGASLTLLDPLGDPGSPANWIASPQPGGTPGTCAPTPPDPPQLRLNELMADNVAAVPDETRFPDWIELHNHSPHPVDLAGWSLTDDSNPQTFVFPTNTPLAAGGFLTVWCDDQTNAPGWHTGFALKRSGDCVFLYDNQRRRVDAVGFGMQPPDAALGRLGDDGRTWGLTLPTPGAANKPAPLASPTNLVINEWMANPLPGGADWIELFNGHPDLSAALQGLSLGNGSAIDQLRMPMFLKPHGHLVLFCDETPGTDHLDFKLPAEGSDLLLYDPTGALLNRVHNPQQTEGIARGRAPDGSARLINFYDGATPGTPNSPSQYAGPFLNEIMARNALAVTNPAGRIADWIELHNPLHAEFDLSGMSVSLDRCQPREWVFPDGTVIGAAGYLLLWCDPGLPPSPAKDPLLNLGRPLHGQSGAVFLFGANDQLVDGVEYGFQIEDRTLGKSGASWRLLASPTPGTSNAPLATLGLTSHLRLNEWMAAPLDGPDWFELFNGDSLPVQLSGLCLSDDPSLAGTRKSPVHTLSFIAGKHWIRFVADDNPFQGRDHAGFRLDAAGETLRLYASSAVPIDSVDFGPQRPGVSEGRLPDGTPTIVPFPTTPTPATMNMPDSDLDGLPDPWESDHGLNPWSGTDAAQDDDGDALTNRQEYEAGTDPQDPTSTLRVDMGTPAPNTVSLRFLAMPDRTYALLSCDGNPQGPWSVRLDVPAAAFARWIELTDNLPPQHNARFYRVLTPAP